MVLPKKKLKKLKTKNAIVGLPSYVFDIKVSSAKLCFVDIYLAMSFSDMEMIFFFRFFGHNF